MFFVQLAVGHHSFPSLVTLALWWTATKSVSVFRERLHEHPCGLPHFRFFDLLLPKRCLQKTASVVFGTLELFSMIELIVTRWKGAEHRDWMQTRQSFRMAIETSGLSLLGLLDVVSYFIGMWPLILSYLKETGKKDSSDSLVVWLFLSVSFFA